MASAELEREVAKEKRRSRARTSRHLPATTATADDAGDTPPPAYTPIEDIDLEDEGVVHAAIANLASTPPVELEPLDGRRSNNNNNRTAAATQYEDEDLYTDEEDEDDEVGAFPFAAAANCVSPACLQTCMASILSLRSPRDLARSCCV